MSEEEFEVILDRLNGLEKGQERLGKKLDEIKGRIANLPATTVRGFRQSGIEMPT